MATFCSIEFLLMPPGILGWLLAAIGGLYVMVTGKSPTGDLDKLCQGGYWLIVSSVLQFAAYAIMCGYGIIKAV